MSEISNQPSAAQGEELDDFDVEGHGLKEVALGLSAATVMAGGVGAAAMALDNPLPGTTAGVQAVASGAYSDAEHRLTWAQGVTTGAVNQAGAAVDDVQQLADETALYATTTAVEAADETVAFATTTVQPVKDQVDATAAEATALAQTIAGDPIGTTDRLVDKAVVTVRDARDSAIATVNTAPETVNSAASSVVTIVSQATGDVERLAHSTIEQAQATVDPQVEASTGSEGTTVTVGAAGTSVTVSAG